MGEIDEIRAGRWDDQIRAGIDQRPETPEAESSQTIDTVALEASAAHPTSKYPASYPYL